MVLAHRTRKQDTFATSWKALGERHFRVRIDLPHDHPFFPALPSGSYDPLLIVEAMRQSTAMVSHAGLGVPLDNHFILCDLEFACRLDHLEVSSNPARMELDVLPSKIEYIAGRPSFHECEWVLRRRTVVVATGFSRMRLISPRVYRRLRTGHMAPDTGPRPGPLLTPRTVGRERQQDVLLAPGDTPQQWRLAVNTCHPTLFQRPNDHIPGMALLEASRQAATALRNPVPFVPSAGRITFQRYAEFGSPCWITARTIPKTVDEQSTKVRIKGVQDNHGIFSCVLEAPAVGC